MLPLPIDPFLPELIASLRTHRALVLVAEPGAGKTTRVPPALLRANFLGSTHPNLIMLQPRRVAARAAAQRIAQENHWQVGDQVGFHIRFEKRIAPHTRLRILTEGILSRMLLSDPFLDTIGAVLLDEFHERSLNSDLAIAMLQELRQTVRDDLYLIVMSATLDAEPVSKFLGNCPILRVPGRLFPVQIEHLAGSHTIPLPDRLAEIIRRELDAHSPGDILAFLPGADEIRRTARLLESRTHDAAILPLHGSLPPAEQTLALDPSPQRKVILATNIAETSLTIDGVSIVIDSGLARIPTFDPRRGLDRLDTLPISKASAAQRAGRAGRTAPGRCIRLWSAKDHANLDDFTAPEIMRVDLAAAVLDLHAWGKPDPTTFNWFQSPPPSYLESAENLLVLLGAIEGRELTPLGRRLMNLPVHPRIGRLLCAAADAGCPDEGAAMAALLSEPQFDDSPTTRSDSDLIDRIPQVAGPVVDQLRRLARELSKVPAKKPTRDTLLKLPLVSYPDRVCRRRDSRTDTAVMVGGGGVRLSPQSNVRDAEFFLALDARHDPRSPTRQAIVQIASAIQSQWLHEFFPRAIVQERQAVFDPDRQRVISRTTVRYRDLVLTEQIDSAPDPEESGQILAQSIDADPFFADPAIATWLARLDLLRRTMPEHPWPTLDKPQLLAELCHGKQSVDQIVPLPVLRSHLTYPLDRLFDQHAPEQIDLPSGRAAKIQYQIGEPPILPVRIQDIFGWKTTPRIAAGRVPLTLHLLGPNQRPVQITSDLQSFWANTYFTVRRDLRARYPRHHWPEDPLTAVPRPRKPRN